MIGALPRDIIVLVSSEHAATERRVTPSWTLATLKSKLEPVTGIPPGSQRLSYQKPDAQTVTSLEGFDPDTTQISSLHWDHYTKLHVEDGRPAGMRDNFTDTSNVEKYEMPEEDYEKLPDSVLAWKKRNQLGRFDPKNAEATSTKQLNEEREVLARNIAVGARCLVGEPNANRRGQVGYVGIVDEIPQGGIWVGIILDEPTGKNDGSVNGTTYFTARQNYGIFIRPGRVLVGDYPPIGLDDDLLEEI